MNDEARTDDAAPTTPHDAAPTTPHDAAPTTPHDAAPAAPDDAAPAAPGSATSDAHQTTGGFAQTPPPPSAPAGSRSGTGGWGSATYGASAGGGGAVAGARGADDSLTWALGAHASALVGGFLGGLPAFVGPLVVWLTRRDSDPFAAEHGREALNFNLSVALYAIALIAVTTLTLGFGLILTLPVGIALGGFWLVASIMAAVRAGNGEQFRYPLTIPFVS